MPTESKYYSLSDLVIDDSDPFSVFPKLDISKSMHVMGDYNSNDYSQMKTSTKFEIKADFYQIQQEAYDRARAYFDTEVTDALGVISDGEWGDGGCPVTSSDQESTFNGRIKKEVLS